jgi:hypothetical protein
MKCDLIIFRKLRGFVISTQIKWQQKNIDFNLAATLQEVLSSLSSITNHLPKQNHQQYGLNLMEDRIVLIRSGLSWATGSLVTIKGRHIIITCSHAITKVSDCFSD